MFLIYIPRQTFGQRPPIIEVYVGCSVRYLRPRKPLVTGLQLELGVGILEFHERHVCNTLQKGGIGCIIAGVCPLGWMLHKKVNLSQGHGLCIYGLRRKSLIFSVIVEFLCIHTSMFFCQIVDLIQHNLSYPILESSSGWLLRDSDRYNWDEIEIQNFNARWYACCLININLLRSCTNTSATYANDA